jgi:hypothetical protein
LDPQDLHTGVDGGAFNEPVTDLVKVLGTLIDSKNHIQIPGFTEGIRHYADIGVPEAADALRNIEECEISIAQVRSAAFFVSITAPVSCSPSPRA